MPEWKRAFREQAATIDPAGPLFDRAPAVAFLEGVAESAAPHLREAAFDPSPGVAELYAIQHAARLVQAAYSLVISDRLNERDLPALDLQESAEAWSCDVDEATVIAQAMVDHLDILTPAEVREALATLLSCALHAQHQEN